MRNNYQRPRDIIRNTESNWSHLESDNIEEVARSKSSVVLKLLVRRINNIGHTDLVIQAIWIVVIGHGGWGMGRSI